MDWGWYPHYTTSEPMLFMHDPQPPVSGETYLCGADGLRHEGATLQAAELSVCTVGLVPPRSGVPWLRAATHTESEGLVGELLLPLVREVVNASHSARVYSAPLTLPCDTPLAVNATPISGAGVDGATTTLALTVECTAPTLLSLGFAEGSTFPPSPPLAACASPGEQRFAHWEFDASAHEHWVAVGPTAPPEPPLAWRDERRLGSSRIDEPPAALVPGTWYFAGRARTAARPRTRRRAA